VKSRHGCLTAWLVLMLLGNSISVLIYLVGSESIRMRVPTMSAALFPVLIVLGVINVVCTIALFQWKKWGFWGFCASGAVTFIINMSAGLIFGAFMGLAGLALLYAVLQIGTENKGWPQLE